MLDHAALSLLSRFPKASCNGRPRGSFHIFGPELFDARATLFIRNRELYLSRSKGQARIDLQNAPVQTRGHVILKAHC